MKLKFQWVLAYVGILVAASTVGCGQGMKPSGGSPETAAMVANTDDQIATAEKAALEAKSAIDEANALITQITDENGNIKIGLFQLLGSAGSGSGLNPLTAKLRVAFDKIFEKVATVKRQFGVARQTLKDVLAKLDQNNPTLAAQIAVVTANLAKLDDLEIKFSVSMHMLASKMDLATKGLDLLVKGVTSFIPGFGAIVGLAIDFLVMDEVKMLILELKLKLMAV